MKIENTQIRTDLAVGTENNRKQVNFIRDLQAYSQQLDEATVLNRTSDDIELTPQAREMQALERSIAELPEMDMDKVAKIKEQIESGHYSIDDTKTASKLLRLELESA